MFYRLQINLQMVCRVMKIMACKQKVAILWAFWNEQTQRSRVIQSVKEEEMMLKMTEHADISSSF